MSRWGLANWNKVSKSRGEQAIVIIKVAPPSFLPPLCTCNEMLTAVGVFTGRVLFSICIIRKKWKETKRNEENLQHLHLTTKGHSDQRTMDNGQRTMALLMQPLQLHYNPQHLDPPRPIPLPPSLQPHPSRLHAHVKRTKPPQWNATTPHPPLSALLWQGTRRWRTGVKPSALSELPFYWQQHQAAPAHNPP